jgi:hypothetical protein
MPVHCVSNLPTAMLLNEKAPFFEFYDPHKDGSKLDGSPALVLIGSAVSTFDSPAAPMHASFTFQFSRVESHTPRFCGSTHVAFVHDHAWSQNALAFLEVLVLI